MPNTHYDTNLSDAAWELVAPLLPPALPGGRPRTTDVRAVVNAIFYLLRSGCQSRLLPREFPAWGTVYHYFLTWKNAGVWASLQSEIYEQTRVAAVAIHVHRW
jgi:putative transposase